MKIILPTLMVSGALLVLTAAGCQKKTEAKAEIDNAQQALAQATPATTPSAATSTTVAITPVTQMHDALASYKSGDLEDAVTRFQKLRAQKAVSAEQMMAINSAMAAVMGDIYLRASKGDARAKQAVKEYERMQNSQ